MTLLISPVSLCFTKAQYHWVDGLIHAHVHTWIIFCGNDFLWVTLFSKVEVTVVQKVVLLQVMSIIIITTLLLQYLLDPPPRPPRLKILTSFFLASAGGIYLQLPWRWYTQLPSGASEEIFNQRFPLSPKYPGLILIETIVLVLTMLFVRIGSRPLIGMVAILFPIASALLIETWVVQSQGPVQDTLDRLLVRSGALV